MTVPLVETSTPEGHVSPCSSLISSNICITASVRNWKTNHKKRISAKIPITIGSVAVASVKSVRVIVIED